MTKPRSYGRNLSEEDTFCIRCKTNTGKVMGAGIRIIALRCTTCRVRWTRSVKPAAKKKT